MFVSEQKLHRNLQNTIPTASTSLKTCHPFRTPLPDLRDRAPRRIADETNPQWYAKLVANASEYPKDFRQLNMHGCSLLGLPDRNVTDSNLARGASSMAFSALTPIVALSLPGFPSMLPVLDHGQIFKLGWPSLRAWL